MKRGLRHDIRIWLLAAGLLLATGTVAAQVIKPPPQGTPPPSGSGSGSLNTNPGTVTVTTTGTAPAPSTPNACSQQSMALLEQAQVTAQQKNAAAESPMQQQIFNGDNAAQIAANCVGSLWPSYGFSLPSIDDLLKSAAQYIINTACATARNAIQQNTTWLSQSTYFSPGFPGAPAYGVNLMQGTPGSGVSLGGGTTYTGGGTLTPPTLPPVPASWNAVQGLFGGGTTPPPSSGH